MIEFKSITKTIKVLDKYTKKNTRKNLLENINFKIKRGEFVFLLGEHGSGKTTLLKMLYKEIEPTSGRILIDNEDISNFNDKEIYRLRRRMGIIFQDYKLMEKRDVYTNIAYPLELIKHQQEYPVEELVGQIAKSLGIESKLRIKTKCLSQGEKQKVAIARALVTRPEILICDEITSNLNQDIIKVVMASLFELKKNYNSTIIFSTYDKNMQNDFEDCRVLNLDPNQ